MKSVEILYLLKWSISSHLCSDMLSVSGLRLRSYFFLRLWGTAAPMALYHS